MIEYKLALYTKRRHVDKIDPNQEIKVNFLSGIEYPKMHEIYTIFLNFMLP